jgi:Spy/CpxP family protein refolding chaperone
LRSSTMRSLGKLALAIGALALMASPALAQGRGGFGGGFGGGAFFVAAPNVQKDMKLSDEQIGKVRDTLREVREKHQDEFAGLRDLSPAEQREKRASLAKAVAEEVKKGLSLSEEQSKRFDQISLQQRGLQAFADPTVQEKLKLTGEQKSKIREIGEAARSSLQGALNKDASKEERQEAFRKMAAMNKENMTKALAELNDDQKKAWKELTGEPITPEFRGRGN